MKSFNVLPEGYKEIYSVNLQKNKKTALLINGLAIVIVVLMVIPALLYVPISTVLSFQEDLGGLLLKLGVFVFADIAYLILHELVHGAAMKLCGTKKVKFGFTGLYAFAGSEDYYCKKPYIFIALAPVVLWGVVLAIVNFIVPVEWFWIVYVVQIVNISGATGDFFVTVKFLGFPSDILVQDSGVGMTVYSRESLKQ